MWTTWWFILYTKYNHYQAQRAKFWISHSITSCETIDVAKWELPKHLWINYNSLMLLKIDWESIAIIKGQCASRCGEKTMNVHYKVAVMTNRQVDCINKRKQQQKLKYNRFLSFARRKKKMKIKIKKFFLLLRLFTFWNCILESHGSSIYKIKAIIIPLCL